MPRLCKFYPDICLTTYEKAQKTPVKVAACTSQADTVQYKKNEQYNTQKKTVNLVYYVEYPGSVLLANHLILCRELNAVMNLWIP
jgi:hypothetical protein